MEVKKLSKEQLEALLTYVIEKYEIGDPQIEELVVKIPTEAVKKSTDLFHGVVCQAQHGREDETYCPYYDEAQLADAWHQSVHLNWIKKAISFMASHEMELDDLKNAIYRVGRARETLQGYKGAEALLRLLLTP
jgi:hypothetical protein